MAKIIAYTRVSSEGQAETGYGLDVQRERIDAYAKSQGVAIDEYVVDDGYSGTTMERPGLRHLLQMCEAGDVSKVIVYSIDRLSRRQRLLLELIEDRFDANNVAFVSVSQQFDTSTPFGKAMLGMLGVFAQLDRDQVVERLSNGRKQRAATGERAVGRIPYGYRSVERDGRRVTEIDEEQAKVVREIFGMRKLGWSTQGIANHLNNSGIAAPRGGRWSQTTIGDMLKNDVYRGVVTYRGETTISVRNEGLALV
jgi:site-specific DNA recombinase